MNYVKEAEEAIEEFEWIKGEMEKVRVLIAEAIEARVKSNEELICLREEEDTDYNRLVIWSINLEDSARLGILDEAGKTLAHLGRQLKVQEEVLNSVKGKLYLARRDLNNELYEIDAEIDKALKANNGKRSVEIAEMQTQRRSMMSLMGKMTKAIAVIVKLRV